MANHAHVPTGQGKVYTFIEEKRSPEHSSKQPVVFTGGALARKDESFFSRVDSAFAAHESSPFCSFESV